MNIGIVVEIIVNFVQQFVFIGFLYLFFDKPKNKAKNAIAFWSAVLILFMMANYYTFNEMTFNHLDSIISVIVMLLYTLLFLKGKVYLRIIMPILTNLLNMIVGYGLLLITNYLGNKSLEESVAFSTAFRYMYLAIGNITYILFLLVVLRLGRGKIFLNTINDIITFILLPLLCMIAMYSDILIYQKIDFNKSVLSLIILNLLIIVVVTFIIWYLLNRISKDNTIKTKLLLSEQRESMYKDAVLDTYSQIEKTSRIKHDMDNCLKAIHKLIINKKYQEASQLCGEMSHSLSNLYTPLNTQNPTLNAIINVELEKAKGSGIAFLYNITDPLLFVSSSDIVSIIGNICDNAIEYLGKIDEKNRRMSLDIFVRLDYYFISCKNSIIESVLKINPSLSSTKTNSSIHGKGIGILQDIVKKYDGEMRITEYDNTFDVTLVIKKTTS